MWHIVGVDSDVFRLLLKAGVHRLRDMWPLRSSIR